MGRPSRIALIALVATAALSGCSSSADPSAVPAEQQEQLAKAVETTTDFCTAAQANVDAGTALSTFASAAAPPRSDDEIKAVLEPVRTSNAQMLDAAPEVAKADLQLVSELSELKLAAFETSKGDPAVASQDPAVVEKTQAATEPSARIRQYLRSVCRIAPN